ncbi:PadR family transcriptional regulator [Sphingomonas sp. R-74633]|uniref:PadR family transcriptional regulator n=1 Tax=Sphingomonas sp. R-74633 TaxID=2751188 RepID=UPI00211EC33B|nr:PadR family transcriptional regulator [Sphingomonas sp. R-74633]
MRHHHCGQRGMHFGGRRGGFGGGGDFFMAFGRGRGGFGGERGERGARRRVFDGTELRLVLLKLIEEQPRHGYDLIREIEERSGGAYAPSPGVVYPTLTMLDDMDLIEESKSEGAKKQFAITAAGTAHLAERTEEVAALFERLQMLGQERERTSGGPIRRAMGNLRAVLQDRLSSEGVDAETLHDVAEILDEAARKIERL